MLQDNFDGYWIVIKYRAIILMFRIDENRVSDGASTSIVEASYWSEGASTDFRFFKSAWGWLVFLSWFASSMLKGVYSPRTALTHAIFVDFPSLTNGSMGWWTNGLMWWWIETGVSLFISVRGCGGMTCLVEKSARIPTEFHRIPRNSGFRTFFAGIWFGFFSIPIGKCFPTIFFGLPIKGLTFPGRVFLPFLIIEYEAVHFSRQKDFYWIRYSYYRKYPHETSRSPFGGSRESKRNKLI